VCQPTFLISYITQQIWIAFGCVGLQDKLLTVDLLKPKTHAIGTVNSHGIF
jgi:hypothetical protein